MSRHLDNVLQANRSHAGDLLDEEACGDIVATIKCKPQVRYYAANLISFIESRSTEDPLGNGMP